ncbi:MAG TPA: hypothetical protein VD813_13785, partial [Pseudonocardia sp.]|nr:hypothetical protein [Pseudonocardia sp.]
VTVARAERPTAAATVRSDVRLLVVRYPPQELRLWDLAEQYLGSRLRYRDLLGLNADRTGPSGEPITEDSLIRHGWTLLMPGDARGPGLIELPGREAARATAQVDLGDPEQAPADVEQCAAPGIAQEPPRVPEPPARTAAPSVSTAPSAPPAPRAPAEPAATAEQPPAADPEETPDPEPTAATAEYPRAPLAWDVVHAGLLADGLLTTLDAQEQRRRERRGQDACTPVPDAATARVEESAHVGADREGAAFLARALRSLAAAVAEQGREMPALAAAHLSATELELRLATPDRHPPAPFTATSSGGRWLLDRAAPLPDVPDVAPRLPGLVSLGADEFGPVLVNLPAGGVLAFEGPAEAVRLVALAVATELVVKRWSEAPDVVLVGFGAELAGATPRLTHRERLSVLLERPVEADIVVLAEPPDDSQLGALRSTVRSAWFGAPAVVVLGAYPRARWRLRLLGRGMLTCPELDITVGAQALGTDTAAAVRRLLAAEGRTGARSEGAAPVALPPGVDPGRAEVLLRLFGPPRLTRGRELVAASPRSVEIIAYLGLMGGATEAELAAAVWPSGVRRVEVGAALAEVATTLGRSRDGTPLLETGEVLRLAPQVQIDWHLVADAAGRGADAQALALAGPASMCHDHDLRHYPWMARLPMVRLLPGIVADVRARYDRSVRDAAGGRRAGRHRRADDVPPSPPTSPNGAGGSTMTMDGATWTLSADDMPQAPRLAHDGIALGPGASRSGGRCA